MEGSDSGGTRGDYGENSPALERFALLLTGDPARAAAVVDEALRRARHDSGLSGSDPRTVRAWLFDAARDIIVGSLPWSPSVRSASWPGGADPDEINASVDRLLLNDALARLPSEGRAVLRGAHYQGDTTAQIAASLRIPERTVKSQLHVALRSLLPHLREMGIGLS